MDDKQRINDILLGSGSSGNKKQRLEQEKLVKDYFDSEKQRVIDKYCEQKYRDLKNTLLKVTERGETEIQLKCGYHTNYDDVLLSDCDFVDKFKLLLAQEAVDPRASILVHKDRICIDVHNNNGYKCVDPDMDKQSPETNGLPSLLVNNLLNYQLETDNKRKQKEQEHLDQAKESYKLVLAKMELAAKQGLSEIQYSPLYDAINDRTYWCNDSHFPLHQKWLYDTNDNIVVYTRRTTLLLDITGPKYNLCWRQRYPHEKLARSLWQSLFGQ